MKVLLVCLACLVVSVAYPEAQVRDLGARNESGRVVVTIPISEAGIRHTAFLSKGEPPDLGALGPTESVWIHFQNTTSNQDFEIIVGTMPYQLRQGTALDLPLRTLLLTLKPGSVGQFTVQSATVTVPDNTGYFTGPGLAPAPPPTASEPGQALVGDPRSQRASTFIRGRQNPMAIAAGTTEQRRIVRIALNGVGVDSWEFRNLRNPPYLLAAGDPNLAALKAQFLQQLADTKQKAQKTAPDLAAKIQTAENTINDEYKTATAKYNEDLKADPKKAVAPQDPWERLALLSATDLEFVNRSVDRTYVINTDIPTPAAIADAKTTTEREVERKKFEAESGLTLGDCVAGPPPTCKVVLSLPNGSPQIFRARYLAGTNAARELDFYTWYTNINKQQPAVAFSIAFFDENATPAEPTAYVSLVPLSSLKEAASKTNWTLSPTLSFNREPYIAKGVTFTPTEDGRYQGDVKRHFFTNVKLVLKQTLGARADATVEFVIKNDSYGVEDETNAEKRVRVSTSLYQVNINSIPGARLSFGKFTFLSPANSIAVKEVGEGFRLSFFNRFAVSNLIKREGADLLADANDFDHRVYLFEANNLSGSRWEVVRGINFLGLFGHDRKAVSKQQYWTTGLDLSYAFPKAPISGVAALYYSDRKPKGTESTVTRGTGVVGYATGAYSWFQPVKNETQPLKVARSVRAEWGRGSTDHLDTKSDEAYLGETSAFAPDVLFLTTFAGKLADVGTRTKSLRHKQYLAGVYQEEMFSPLELLAAFWIPEEDIASRLFRTGARWYYFDGKIMEGNDARNGGIEWFADTQIETPAGVKSSVVLSWYRPGAAVRGYFKNGMVWSLVSKITVSLGS